MKITREISNIDEFEAWSGAVYTYNAIIENHKQDDFMLMLEEIFPDGCTETELNDFLWFDDEYIFSTLNIKQS